MPSIFAAQPSAPPVQDPRDTPTERESNEDANRDDDNEQEGGGAQMRLPPSVRERFTGGLQTVGDALELCAALFSEQLGRAALEKPLPNQPINGDGAARSAFLLLLTDGQQRDLFLRTASSSANWSRLRPLVGAPPYHFLRPQDASVLSATGFARGRANMTYESANRIANHQQFGAGQLVDEHTREYRIAPRNISSEDPLPGSAYLRSAKDIVLHVKVKRHGIQKKRELFNSEFKRQLFFPQVGEQIVLRESSALMNARGLRQPSSTAMRVKALWPRGQGASTAAVLVGF